MNKSFQLIRTNPRLTTNIKLVVDSKYNLYFESFNSSKELSNDKYKHYLLNRESILENEIPKFYSGLPKNIAFSPRTQDDSDVMYNEYKQQFDNTYYSGANEVEDQTYTEEYEYFAPLYFRKNNFPKNFIIFRVDDPSIYVQSGYDYDLGILNKDNFREEIIDKWKCVSVFDLTDNTNLGKFIDRNINDNSRFPDFSLFFDTKSYNYSKWSGIDYNTGVYNTAELFLDDKLFYSNGHFNLEEFITKGFENNNIIYPYILNVKFLFDDKRGTSEEMLPWTMNRYYGFYADDLELVTTITSKKLPLLKPNLTIKNNIFLYNDEYINPFLLNLNDDQWIQIENKFYEVKKQPNGSFKIISDIKLSTEDLLNIKYGNNTINYIDNKNYISNLDKFDEYIDENGDVKYIYADTYLIEIDGLYHVLKKDENDQFYVQCDYAILSTNNTLQYWKGGINSDFSKIRDNKNDDGSPLSFKIYRINFTDIKDFDFDRIVTKYSDFDYEKSTYYDTPEVKLYATEYRDNSVPKRIKTHDKGEDGQYKPMVISSEYTACDETFELQKSKITPVFEKNQSICKWGYDGSISHSDYSYKLNNNFKCGGSYNRTVNTELKKSNIKEKTLDYFYRIGEFYEVDQEVITYKFDDDFDYSDINTLWEGDTTTGVTNGWFYSSSLTGLWAQSDMPNTTLIIESKEIVLVPGNRYYVRIGLSTGDLDGDVGIESSTFLNGTISYKKTGTIIEITGFALSDKFKLFMSFDGNNPDGMVQIHDIFISGIKNKYYLNQSTNIQTGILKNYDIKNITRVFNLDLYIESNFDYFDFFFKNNMIYEDYGKLLEKPYLKYSVFGGGDNELPSTTLFKGIEYSLFSIEDIVLNESVGNLQTIRNIITNGGEKYNGYKFSVILNEYYNYYTPIYDQQMDIINYDFVGNISDSIFGIEKILNNDKDGIHVILNEKFKNVLIIINKNIPFEVKNGTLNNINIFGENYGLYKGETLNGDKFINASLIPGLREYNPDTLTASYFIESLNKLNTKNVYDTYINYYMVDIYGNFAKTEMINFNETEENDRFRDLSLWNKKYPPFYIQTSKPDPIRLKKDSYKIKSIKGPETNIYDKYIKYSNRIPIKESFIDQPLSRKIEKYEVDNTKNVIYHGEKISNFDLIYRYVGYYEPVFKQLNIFKPTYYWDNIEQIGSLYGNYSFNTELEQFGLIDEIMYSKVNELENYLKLKDNDIDRSYYPMIDEIGLSQTDRFIFSSPWDRNFYIKTLNEQTFLENYVQKPQTQSVSVINADILTSTLLSSGFDNTSYVYQNNNANIYGFEQSTGLTYQVTIKNTSNSPQEFGFSVNFSTRTSTLPTIYTGQTSLLQPNATETLSFSAKRPNENKTLLPLSSFTRYNIDYKCFQTGSTSILDTYKLNKIDVWNNLINPQLIQHTGYTSGQNYNVNGSVNFGVVLGDSGTPQITATGYTVSLSIEKQSGGWLIMSSKVVTKQSNILLNVLFNDIILVDDLFNTTGTYTADIKFDVSYTYKIEGVNQFKTDSLTLTDYMTITKTTTTAPPTTAPPVNYTCDWSIAGLIVQGEFVFGTLYLMNNTGGTLDSVSINFGFGSNAAGTFNNILEPYYLDFSNVTVNGQVTIYNWSENINGTFGSNSRVPSTGTWSDDTDISCVVGPEGGGGIEGGGQ